MDYINVTACKMLIDSQAAKGLGKYGVPLEESDASVSRLAHHGAEEMADALAYFVELGRRAKGLEIQIDTMKTGIQEIMDKIRSGEICGCDVLWFNEVITLWERLDQLAGGGSCADCGGHDGKHSDDCPIPW
jgi:hypothetical protein